MDRINRIEEWEDLGSEEPYLKLRLGCTRLSCLPTRSSSGCRLPVGRVGDELASELAFAKVTRLLYLKGIAWLPATIELSYPIDPVHPVSDFSYRSSVFRRPLEDLP